MNTSKKMASELDTLFYSPKSQGYRQTQQLVKELFLPSRACLRSHSAVSESAIISKDLSSEDVLFVKDLPSLLSTDSYLRLDFSTDVNSSAVSFDLQFTNVILTLLDRSGSVVYYECHFPFQPSLANGVEDLLNCRWSDIVHNIDFAAWNQHFAEAFAEADRWHGVRLSLSDSKEFSPHKDDNSVSHGGRRRRMSSGPNQQVTTTSKCSPPRGDSQRHVLECPAYRGKWGGHCRYFRTISLPFLRTQTIHQRESTHDCAFTLDCEDRISDGIAGNSDNCIGIGNSNVLQRTSFTTEPSVEQGAFSPTSSFDNLLLLCYHWMTSTSPHDQEPLSTRSSSCSSFAHLDSVFSPPKPRLLEKATPDMCIWTDSASPNPVMTDSFGSSFSTTAINTSLPVDQEALTMGDIPRVSHRCANNDFQLSASTYTAYAYEAQPQLCTTMSTSYKLSNISSGTAIMPNLRYPTCNTITEAPTVSSTHVPATLVRSTTADGELTSNLRRTLPSAEQSAICKAHDGQYRGIVYNNVPVSESSQCPDYVEDGRLHRMSDDLPMYHTAITSRSHLTPVYIDWSDQPYDSQRTQDSGSSSTIDPNSSRSSCWHLKEKQSVSQTTSIGQEKFESISRTDSSDPRRNRANEADNHEEKHLPSRMLHNPDWATLVTRLLPAKATEQIKQIWKDLTRSSSMSCSESLLTGGRSKAASITDVSASAVDVNMEESLQVSPMLFTAGTNSAITDVFARKVRQIIVNFLGPHVLFSPESIKPRVTLNVGNQSALNQSSEVTTVRERMPTASVPIRPRTEGSAEKEHTYQRPSLVSELNVGTACSTLSSPYFGKYEKSGPSSASATTCEVDGAVRSSAVGHSISEKRRFHSESMTTLARSPLSGKRRLSYSRNITPCSEQHRSSTSSNNSCVLESLLSGGLDCHLAPSTSSCNFRYGYLTSTSPCTPPGHAREKIGNCMVANSQKNPGSPLLRCRTPSGTLQLTSEPTTPYPLSTSASPSVGPAPGKSSMAASPSPSSRSGSLLVRLLHNSQHCPLGSNAGPKTPTQSRVSSASFCGIERPPTCGSANSTSSTGALVKRSSVSTSSDVATSETMSRNEACYMTASQQRRAPSVPASQMYTSANISAASPCTPPLSTCSSLTHLLLQDTPPYPFLSYPRSSETSEVLSSNYYSSRRNAIQKPTAASNTSLSKTTPGYDNAYACTPQPATLSTPKPATDYSWQAFASSSDLTTYVQSSSPELRKLRTIDGTSFATQPCTTSTSDYRDIAKSVPSTSCTSTSPSCLSAFPYSAERSLSVDDEHLVDASFPSSLCRLLLEPNPQPEAIAAEVATARAKGHATAPPIQPFQLTVDPKIHLRSPRTSTVAPNESFLAVRKASDGGMLCITDCGGHDSDDTWALPSPITSIQRMHLQRASKEASNSSSRSKMSLACSTNSLLVDLPALTETKRPRLDSSLSLCYELIQEEAERSVSKCPDPVQDEAMVAKICQQLQEGFEPVKKSHAPSVHRDSWKSLPVYQNNITPPQDMYQPSSLPPIDRVGCSVTSMTSDSNLLVSGDHTSPVCSMNVNWRLPSQSLDPKNCLKKINSGHEVHRGAVAAAARATQQAATQLCQLSTQRHLAEQRERLLRHQQSVRVPGIPSHGGVIPLQPNRRTRASQDQPPTPTTSVLTQQPFAESFVNQPVSPIDDISRQLKEVAPNVIIHNSTSLLSNNPRPLRPTSLAPATARSSVPPHSTIRGSRSTFAFPPDHIATIPQPSSYSVPTAQSGTALHQLAAGNYAYANSSRLAASPLLPHTSQSAASVTVSDLVKAELRQVVTNRSLLAAPESTATMHADPQHDLRHNSCPSTRPSLRGQPQMVQGRGSSTVSQVPLPVICRYPSSDISCTAMEQLLPSTEPAFDYPTSASTLTGKCFPCSTATSLSNSQIGPNFVQYGRYTSSAGHSDHIEAVMENRMSPIATNHMHMSRLTQKPSALNADSIGATSHSSCGYQYRSPGNVRSSELELNKGVSSTAIPNPLANKQISPFKRSSANHFQSPSIAASSYQYFPRTVESPSANEQPAVALSSICTASRNCVSEDLCTTSGECLIPDDIVNDVFDLESMVAHRYPESGFTHSKALSIFGSQPDTSGPHSHATQSVRSDVAYNLQRSTDSGQSNSTIKSLEGHLTAVASLFDDFPVP